LSAQVGSFAKFGIEHFCSLKRQSRQTIIQIEEKCSKCSGETTHAFGARVASSSEVWMVATA
jgi:hypothetical protein